MDTQKIQDHARDLIEDGKAVDLNKMSAEDLTAAVMRTISERGIAGEKLTSLGISFLDLLNELKAPISIHPFIIGFFQVRSAPPQSSCKLCRRPQRCIFDRGKR